MRAIDETHRSDLRSWVEAANAPGGDFPIQNLPFGVFKRSGERESPRVGVAIGDQIVDVYACSREGLLPSEAALAGERCASSRLNDLAELGRGPLDALRRALSRLLRTDAPAQWRDRFVAERMLIPMSHAELRLPFEVGDYSDFYASIAHATNLGSMFRPENPLLPNYKYVPIGYHGRASSLVPSGTPVRRPCGQIRGDDDSAPVFAPTRRMDYELELGYFVSTGNALGVPVPIAEAGRHLFGCCLVNDWSARDVQAWEYQPLGPFLAKSFATTISPWVVTMSALEPYRAPAYERPPDDPVPLPYLADDDDRREGGIDATLAVWLRTARMREHGDDPVQVSRVRSTQLYWTAAQLLAHHTSNGCNLRPGDLLGSGTISGPERDARGSLIELAWRGTQPLVLPRGESRSFLEDGDEVIMRAWCERSGFARIGFGECRGIVEPAHASAARALTSPV